MSYLEGLDVVDNLSGGDISQKEWVRHCFLGMSSAVLALAMIIYYISNGLSKIGDLPLAWMTFCVFFGDVLPSSVTNSGD
jgi:hypothetical protein